MIVRRHEDRLLLITQPEHAHLAATIMARAVRLSGSPRRDAILHAVREHDNGWAEEDQAPSVDPKTGEILDFVTVPVATRQRVWPRGIARLADDPWAAALVAHHAYTVYERFRSDAEWARFFAAMLDARDARLRASGRTLGDLLADYEFVRLGDLISLAFCAGWTDRQGFADWTVQLSGARVAVTPDAFGGATIPIEVTAREIRRERSRSDGDLREAWTDAQEKTLRGEVF
jgi:Protein of unknown function (DUF3891)